MEGKQQIIRVGNYTSQFGGKDLLGTGSFGIVYAGHQINNRKNKVAIKLISLEQSSQKQIMKEVLCMLNLRSQGTLEIFASGKIKFGAKKQQYYAIVTEKMNGSLRDLLKEKEKLTEAQTIEWGRKIIECYKYIHKAQVMHRDLKPDNVLYRKFGDQIIFKIADFGLSKNLNSSNLSNKGTPFYVSPQQEKQGKYTDKTDVYAFGCILFEFLVGPKKLFSEVIKLIQTNNQSINKKEAVKVARKILDGIGVSKIMIQLIEGCLMYEESDRLAWEDIFNHQIFEEPIKVELNNQHEIVPEKKNLETNYVKHEIVPAKKDLEINYAKMEEPKINKLRITPDTSTYAWKKKIYTQQNANKNICVYQGKDGSFQWLCSSELDCDGEFVFTIKAIKVIKRWNKYSCIGIGVMENKKKIGQTWENTMNNSVYLNLWYQLITRPNEEQTDWSGIKCSCQQVLSSFPCLIDCHVNRNQSTITWHYNGKKQAKSSMPNSWKDGRKLCAVVCISNKGDCVEFM